MTDLPTMPNGAKRWCFTLNNYTESDVETLKSVAEHALSQDVERALGSRVGDDDGLDGPSSERCDIRYAIWQSERGDTTGTRHLQGFLILARRRTLAFLRRTFSGRAHFEVARGTDQQARDYCRKEDTYDTEAGIREEFGALPERDEAPPAKKSRARAIEQIEVCQQTIVRPGDIAADVLLQQNFIAAYNLLQKHKLGPYRRLTIITIVGPPGTGKSYAAFSYYPDHALVIYGNCGQWVMNAGANAIFFEEFHGQIPLAKMLQYLDGYPFALEVKGGTEPAMYETVVITSNTKPCDWYPMTEEEKATNPRKLQAIHALYDRIGYSGGGYIPVRHCGHYLELPTCEHVMRLGLDMPQYFTEARKCCWKHFHDITGRDPSDGSEETTATADAEPDEATQDLPSSEVNGGEVATITFTPQH